MLLRGIIPLQTFLVIVASFVLVTVESQVVSVYPSSVSTQSGKHNIRLSCNVTGLPPNAYIEWIYYPNWSVSGITIYSTYDGINNDPTNFTVLPMKTVGRHTHSLDLVINTVQPLLAAQYLCNVRHKHGKAKSIHVFVVDPMECPISTVEYDEDKEANLSCSVNYYDSTQTYTPRITWKRDRRDRTEVPGVIHLSESLTRKKAILKKNVTSADDNKKFVCVVDFAKSNPRYIDDCSTVVYVRHAVSQIRFDPPSSAEAPTDVAVRDVIDCRANGRPAPMIEWYDNNGTLLSEFRKLFVTEEMRSWEQPITLYCRANNTIDNGATFAGVEGNYTFNVVNAPTIQICRLGPTGTWIIAVVVIVPIVVIAAIAIAAFFIIRHCKKKAKSTEKTTKGRSTYVLLFNY